MSITIQNIRLEKGDGGAATANQTVTAEAGPFDVNQSVGGATDPLGATWTGLDLNDPAMQLVLQAAQGGSFGDILTIDYVTVTVWHSEAVTPATGPCKVFNTEGARKVEIETKSTFSIFKAKARP